MFYTVSMKCTDIVFIIECTLLVFRVHVCLLADKYEVYIRDADFATKLSLTH